VRDAGIGKNTDSAVTDAGERDGKHPYLKFETVMWLKASLITTRVQGRDIFSWLHGQRNNWTAATRGLVRGSKQPNIAMDRDVSSADQASKWTALSDLLRRRIFCPAMSIWHRNRCRAQMNYRNWNDNDSLRTR
jgi:hypothetical protein